MLSRQDDLLPLARHSSGMHQIEGALTVKQLRRKHKLNAPDRALYLTAKRDDAPSFALRRMCPSLMWTICLEWRSKQETSSVGDVDLWLP
jgi:hypothetical protein